MKKIMIFDKFIGKDTDSKIWGVVHDSIESAKRPAIFLYPNGIMGIPKKDDKIIVDTGIDADYLYIVGNVDNNTESILIDNENKTLTIDNIDIMITNIGDSYTLDVTNSINIIVPSFVVDSVDIKLGSSGANLTPITIEDVNAGLLIYTPPSTGIPLPVTIVGVPLTTKVKVE